MRMRDEVRLAWREFFAQGVCTYAQKRRGPEGLSYRGLSGKDLSLHLPGFLYVRELVGFLAMFLVVETVKSTT